MFTVIIEKSVRQDLKNAAKKSTTILTKLDSLDANPLSSAAKTEVANIGQYYLNAGRFSIVFDIDTENNKVYIRSVVLSSLLYKVISGRIQTPDRMLVVEEDENENGIK